jgi:hypothetical protein
MLLAIPVAAVLIIADIMLLCGLRRPRGAHHAGGAR